MTQPTVTRHHTWKASTGLNEQVVNHAGEVVTVHGRVTLQAYLHTFTLTCETWAGSPAASGWWLRVEGEAAGPEGTFQRVAAPTAHWRNVVRSTEVRQIVGFAKAAWSRGRESNLCEECRQERSATGACWC